MSTNLEKIAKELISTASQDQGLRGDVDKNRFSIEELDHINTERTKAIIEEIGYPTISKVEKRSFSGDLAFDSTFY